MSEGENQEEDSGGIFCQNCSPTTRKLGYYGTFLVGLLVFIIGIINLIGGDPLFMIVGSLGILLSPLWIKSPQGCMQNMKNGLRLSSTLIFLAFLVLSIICHFSGWGIILDYVFGIGLGVSGIWYFLSFFPNGQKACVACIKSCCSSDKGTSE